MKHKTARAIIILCITLSTMTAQASRMPRSNQFIKKNGLEYKQPREEQSVVTFEKLKKALSDIQTRKSSGAWSIDGNKTNTSPSNQGVNSDTYFESGGLRSITPEMKSKIRLHTKNIQKRHPGRSYESLLGAFKEYKSVANNNIAMNFDITSPGSLLSSKDVVDWVEGKGRKYTKPGAIWKTYEYNLDGKKVTMTNTELMAEAYPRIRNEVARQAQLGKVVNPDFLLALTAHETGWATGKVFRNTNSWFSYGAFNHNPNAAIKFNSPEEATESIINALIKDYLSPQAKYYQEDAGGTNMFGTNHLYCKEDHVDFPGFGWSNGITNTMIDMWTFKGQTVPTF